MTYGKAKASSCVLAAFLLMFVSTLSAAADTPVDSTTRTEVEARLAVAKQSFESNPNDQNRREYANTLFKLGDIGQAKDVFGSLGSESSTNPDDVKLGAKITYLLGDYKRAEAMYKRLMQTTDRDSDLYTTAVKGLVLTYYQLNEYTKVKDIPSLDSTEANQGVNSLLTFMKRFEGTPYRIEWKTADKVATLPIINDFTQPGALPRVHLEINGHQVEFILDTGGDRLYIDEGVAKEVGIKTISKRRARYAYTKGEWVDEPLGVAETVTMGDVTLTNVPVIVAKWKVMGPTSDGVVTTQVLRQFLSTIDYDKKQIVFRERGVSGHRRLMASYGEKTPISLPFVMSGSHMMFTKGSLNGHQGMNMFMDCGLAASMPLVIQDQTRQLLGLEKHDIDGTKMYWSPIEAYGIGTLVRGPAQALGNVTVEKDAYWANGFIFDALISHQYLWHLGSWTIDFDNMTYYFPASAAQSVKTTSAATTTAQAKKIKIANPDQYVGTYEIVPGTAFEISAANGTLFIQAPGQQKIGLQAEPDGTFSIPLAGATVTFERDADGTITGLVLKQAGNETPATKK